MSRNAANKLRAKARHRDEFSRWPRSCSSLNDLIYDIQPLETPLLMLIRGHLSEAERG